MVIWIKRILITLVAVVTALFIAFILFINFGPISSPAMILSAIFGTDVESPPQSVIAHRLQVPEGFTLEIYATGVKNARILAATSYGDLIVSQPKEGKVTLLKRDSNGDGHPDGDVVLLDQLTRPHGLALHQNYLYIAESNAIGRIPIDAENGVANGQYETIIANLPDAGNHWLKSIAVQDDKLFVSIGSSCNVCEEDDERRAAILRFDRDGSNQVLYATGLRNSVGMDFTPWDGALFATDNGRDFLGDDFPPCELNNIVEGGFYGWPYINGFGKPDPDFGEAGPDGQPSAISPAHGFNAHNAPLGIQFLQKASRPAGYERAALVALHGSWNRSKPDGYKVVSLHWQVDGSIISNDFLTGFEHDGDIIGRPVDIEEGPDGCLFVSDDYSGTIYRVCYGKQQQTSRSDKQIPESTATSDGSAPQKNRLLVSMIEPDVKASISRGKHLFDEHNCEECHLLNGEGNGTGKVLTALSQRYTPESLAEYFLAPNPPMPPYALALQDRLDLATYLLVNGNDRP